METSSPVISIKYLFLIYAIPIIGISQRIDDDRMKDLGLSHDFLTTKVTNYRVTSRSQKWLTLRQDFKPDPRNIFSQYSRDFNLGVNDRADLISSLTDDLGISHFKYQQFFKGVLVEGAEMLIHTGPGRPIRINGHFADNLIIDVAPKFSSEAALEIALATIDADSYMWESPAMESRLRESRQDSLATYYPSSQLVIVPPNIYANHNTAKYQLAFKFDIYSLIPSDGKSVYVHAHLGSVIKIVQLVPDATGTTLYNGNQTLTTEYRPSENDYILNDIGRGGGIHTWSYVSPTSIEEIDDPDNGWFSVSQRPGVSGHWAAEMTYDYFNTTFNRDSYDGSGGALGVITNYIFGTNPDNAQWWPPTSDLRLGRGGGLNTYDDLVSLDVVGHEFGHGIDQYTANLTYSYESGALDESFADIYGTMVEFYAEGTGGNYEIGEDFWISDGKLRDMSDPHSKDDPDTYGTNDINWYDHTGCTSPDDDNCGVHTNSGVQNYWFYLLAEGGSGTNENSIKVKLIYSY